MSRPERTYIDPEINLESAPYWEATKEGKLMLKKCGDCGETHFYPRTLCPNCFSDNTEWFQASGKGKIYTYSVIRRAEIPYVIAYVTLEEGVTMLSNIVDCGLDDVSVGQAVEVDFRATEGGEALPVFKPAG